jgi:hypothetical protein
VNQVGLDGGQTAPVQKEEAQVNYQQWAQRLGFQNFLPPLKTAVRNPFFITEILFIATK